MKEYEEKGKSSWDKFVNCVKEVIDLTVNDAKKYGHDLNEIIKKNFNNKD